MHCNFQGKYNNSPWARGRKHFCIPRGMNFWPTSDKPKGRKTFSSRAKWNFAREEKVFLPEGLSRVGYQKFMSQGMQKCFLTSAHGELVFPLSYYMCYNKFKIPCILLCQNSCLFKTSVTNYTSKNWFFLKSLRVIKTDKSLWFRGREELLLKSGRNYFWRAGGITFEEREELLFMGENVFEK